MQTTASQRTPPARCPIGLDDLFSVEEFVAANSRLITLHTLRQQLRDRAHNGLGKAVLPFGRKLLISKSGYERWLATLAGTTSRQAKGRQHG